MNTAQLDKYITQGKYSEADELLESYDDEDLDKAYDHATTALMARCSLDLLPDRQRNIISGNLRKLMDDQTEEPMPIPVESAGKQAELFKELLTPGRGGHGPYPDVPEPLRHTACIAAGNRGFAVEFLAPSGYPIEDAARHKAFVNALCDEFGITRMSGHALASVENELKELLQQAPVERRPDVYRNVLRFTSALIEEKGRGL